MSKKNKIKNTTKLEMNARLICNGYNEKEHKDKLINYYKGGFCKRYISVLHTVNGHVNIVTFYTNYWEHSVRLSDDEVRLIL